jgi:hypothetical protein
MSPVSNLLLRVLQELEYPVVADEYMLNQLGMVLEVLPEYAERAASKLRACGEHDVLSNGPPTAKFVGMARILCAPALVPCTSHTGVGVRVH